MQKIDRVTRQRRLSVPNGNGADATDPNVVAAYLDNELPSDQVAEYEKKCLTSDVHLAEVASVHQILSLIGQKAKVPPEARHRMYRLIKGREAVGDDVPRPDSSTNGDPTFEPVVPWEASEIADHPWYERFGPSLGVVALILILAFSAWKSVGPSPKDGDEQADLAVVAEQPSPIEKKPVDVNPTPKKRSPPRRPSRRRRRPTRRKRANPTCPPTRSRRPKRR